MSRFDEMRIFSGTGNPTLAQAISSYIGIRHGELSIHTFPNENIFVKIEESVREQDVFVVQSLGAPLNHLIMEMLIMLDAFKRASAGRITAVIPYLAYSRTDKKRPTTRANYCPFAGRPDRRCWSSTGADPRFACWSSSRLF